MLFPAPLDPLLRNVSLEFGGDSEWFLASGITSVEMLVRGKKAALSWEFTITSDAKNADETHRSEQSAAPHLHFEAGIVLLEAVDKLAVGR